MFTNDNGRIELFPYAMGDKTRYLYMIFPASWQKMYTIEEAYDPCLANGGDWKVVQNMRQMIKVASQASDWSEFISFADGVMLQSEIVFSNEELTKLLEDCEKHVLALMQELTLPIDIRNDKPQPFKPRVYR